ncbi:MAG: sigma-70 family RNA polymerase sigma factor [Candidatus Komeilibacteria bacterium]|nr:sigma-70 family RNA polymerase sigma factor [Candidatus Komeilibacteria bacterium]
MDLSVTANVEQIKQTDLETERLLVLAAQADPAEFGQLYELYFDKIYHFLLSRSGFNRELAEDLTSQTFLQALEKINRFKWQGVPFGAWLYRIAINNLNSHWRKHKRVLTTDDDNLAKLADDFSDLNQTDASTVDQFDLAALYKAIKQLSEEDQNLLALKYFQDLSYEEISAAIGLSVNSVGVKLHRAVKKLKKLL